MLANTVIMTALMVGAAPDAMAQAEGQDHATSAPHTSDSGVEGIVVTARRREERLLDVPLSIAVFDGATLEAAKIDSLNDLIPNIPNITIAEAQQPGVAFINVRGISQARNGEPPIAMVVDGVQISNSYQITQSLLDVEQIEVLKGPQGALYGRNAIGGAIVITTRQPTNDFEGEVRAGYATGQDYRADARISGPIISDIIRFKAALNYRDFRGDIPNVFAGDYANSDREINLRFGLLVTPTDNLKIDLRYARLDGKGGGAWYAPRPTGNNNDVLDFSGTFNARTTRKIDDLSLKIDLELPGALLTSVSGYSKVDSSIEQDIDFLPANLLNVRQTINTEAVSQELRLSSVDSHALTWLVGGYFLDTKYAIASPLFIPLDPTSTTLNPPGSIVSPSEDRQHNQSFAGFGELSYRFDNGLALTGAFRYDIDKRKTLTRDRKLEFRSFQPRLTAAYFFDGSHQIYVSAARGYRSGGFNATPRIILDYRPETVWTYEAGFKGKIGTGATLSLAAYYNDISDRQAFTLDVINFTQTILNPIPKARSYGIEADLQFQPLDGFKIAMAGALQQTKIVRYDTAPLAGLPSAGDFTGNRLPFSPSVSASMTAQYDWKVSDQWSFTPRFEVNLTGPYYWEIDNRDRRETEILANLRFTLANGGFSLTAYAENLFDNGYNIEFVNQRFSGIVGGDVAARGRGRTVGIIAGYKF